MVSLNKEVEVDAEVQQAVDKLLGLKTYTVDASELVYYSVEIQAYSLEEAWEKARSGEVHYSVESIYDGADFDIIDVELTETLGE